MAGVRDHLPGRGVRFSPVPAADQRAGVTRLSWDTYFLNIAAAVAARADCTRRQVGAVIVKDNRVVSTGYNGAPAGEPGCLTDRACPRGRHGKAMFHPFDDRWDKKCVCGGDWPCPEAVEIGSSYDTSAGACIAIHAEMNSIMYSSRDERDGATLYVTDYPCDGCYRQIRGSGILRLVTPEGSEQWYRTVHRH